MNKRNLIIGIVVLIALIGGVVLYITLQSQKNTEVKKNKPTIKIKPVMEN